MKATAMVGELRDHREILRRVKEAYHQGDFSLIIVFPTLSLLREVEEELLQQPGYDGIGGIRFLLFEGFILEIAERFGLNHRRPTALQRELLITEAFRMLNQTGRLSYLNRAPLTSSYRAALLDGIAEWKRAGLTTDLFIKWVAEKGDKEQQLALLYFTYQHLLTANGFAEEDRLLDELKEVRANALPGVATTRVLLYGYTDLTPLQRDFIDTLSLWFEFEALVDPTAVAAFHDLMQQHFHWKKPNYPEAATGKTVLERLQQSFWTTKPEAIITPEAEAPSVQMLLADGWVRQATGIAREICALLRADASLEWDDFLILSPQPQGFIKSSYPVFAEYGLRLEPPPRLVREYQGVIRFLQALETAAEGWQWPDLEIFIRQSYAGEVSENRDLLLLRLGRTYGALSGKERWLELLDNPRFRIELVEQGLDPEPLEEGIDFLQSIPESGTWASFLNLAREWFEVAAGQALESLSDEAALMQTQLLNYEAVSRLQQACEEMLRNLHLSEMMDGETTLEEFRRFVSDYLLKEEVERKEPFQARLRVLPPREARGLRARVVFVTGLEQGVFPRIYINDWKLSPQDRFDLRTLGVELETGETYQQQEKLAFYWALQTAEQRLYLVSRVQDDGGQPLNPSPFLSEVAEWLPDLAGRAQYYPLEPRVRQGFADCFSRAEERQLWIHYLLQDPEVIPAAERTTCDYLFMDPRFRELAVKVHQWRFRRRLEPEKSFYTHPDAALVLEERFGADRSLAITMLEEYRTCPYRFFLKQLLRVRPLLEPQLLPEQIDFGNLYHQILREFGEYYRGKVLEPKQWDGYLARLEKSFRHNFAKWKEKAANDLVALVLSIQEKQIRQTLKRWLAAELEWAETTGGRYTSRFLEYSFGLPPGAGDPASLSQPLLVETAAGSVCLQGRIDRVDTEADGHFVVYDYKLGKAHTSGTILELKNLQMPLYIKALEQLSLGSQMAVGGSYLSLKEPSRTSGGVWRQAKVALEGRSKGLLGEEQWQQWLAEVENVVVATVQAIRSGEIYLTADKCPDFCEYRVACRRQEREEERANGASA